MLAFPAPFLEREFATKAIEGSQEKSSVIHVRIISGLACCGFFDA